MEHSLMDGNGERGRNILNHQHNTITVGIVIYHFLGQQDGANLIPLARYRRIRSLFTSIHDASAS